jgi:4-amino-4-deoxy-L-arabinose transferase-like glycosyltransferase
MRVTQSRIPGALLGFLAWDRAVYVILVAGLLVRIAALGLIGHEGLRNEAPGYMEVAAQLLHSETFDPYWPPGVPYYLYVAQKLFGESILVARASILPIYAVFTAFLFTYVKKLGSLRAANLAALVFVFYPPYVRHSFNPSTEYPAAACVMGVVLLLTLAGRRPTWGLGAFVGILLGLLILIRPSSLLVAAFAFFHLLSRHKGARTAVVSLAVLLVLVSAWVWKAHTLTGRFVMINESNALNFFWGNNPYTPLYATWGEAQGQLGLSEQYKSLLARIDSRPPSDRDRLYFRYALQHLRSRPDLFLIRTFNRARAYFGFPVHSAEPLKSVLGDQGRKWASVAITVADVSFYWPILVLTICFFFSTASSSVAVGDKIALLGTAAAYALPYWVAMSQPRYNFPVVPLLVVPAVLLLDSLAQKPVSEVFRPVIASRWRRYVLALSLFAFIYIQLEWIYVAYVRLQDSA